MKDFLQNRPRISPGIQPIAGAKPSPGTPPAFDAAMLGAMSGAHGAGGHEATVEAIKEGDRVTKLIVTCKCGEKIEILCAYGPGPR